MSNDEHVCIDTSSLALDRHENAFNETDLLVETTIPITKPTNIIRDTESNTVLFFMNVICLLGVSGLFMQALYEMNMSPDQYTAICTLKTKTLFNESGLNDYNQIITEIDLIACYPEQTPHINWAPPASPSLEEFEQLHPAYPPARFLAAFAQGQWSDQFERYEVHPNPTLSSELYFNHIINESLSRNNVNVNSTQFKYCDNEEDPTYGVDQLPLTGSFAQMHWYSSSQACWILSHFTTLTLIGDSLMRHTYSALIQVLTENYVDGQINLSDMTGINCTGDAGYEEETCRDKIAFDLNNAARKVCPRLHLDDLPNNWHQNIEFKSDYNASDIYDPFLSSSSTDAFINLIVRPSYHHVFVRSELGINQRFLPPILSKQQRRTLQRRRAHVRRRTKQGYQGGGSVPDAHMLHNKDLDREEFVYPLPDQIGALVIEELGYHEISTPKFPDDVLNYYHEEMNVLQYESHAHSPPQPVYPLYYGLHATIGPLIDKWVRSKEWRKSLDNARASTLSPTIDFHLQAQHNPSHYYQDMFSTTEIDLSLLHYSSHMTNVTPVDTSKSILDWQKKQNIARCDFDIQPLGSLKEYKFTTSRECCSHSVRPWQFMDPLGLTKGVPFSWSYDGRHYKQRVNLYKAQAILNYAHTLIQQHQRIKQSKT